MEDLILDKDINTEKLKPIEPIKGRWQFLWISIVASFLPMIGEAFLVASMIGIFTDLSNGDTSSVMKLYQLAETEKTILVFYYMFFIVSVIAVSMWVHRANKNLGSAGLKEIEQSPGMAVWWFFIPVANWFMPFVVMREIEKGSASMSKPHENRSWKNNRVHPVMVTWFVTHTVSMILFAYLYFKTKMLQSNPGASGALESFLMICYLYLVAYFIRVVSGIALIFFSKKVTQFHNEHIELEKNQLVENQVL